MNTILVVEDSPSSREVVLRLLKRGGYNAVGAANAEEAFDRLQQATPDLVLLDIMMPETDGFTLLARLRSQPAFKNLPVIMMTALSDDSRIARAKELGVTTYLVKSRFSYDDLMRHVGNNVRHPTRSPAPVR